jgi:hypothetical protein
VVFFETVLETIAPVTASALDTLSASSTDERLTRGVGALSVMIKYCGFWWQLFRVVLDFAPCPLALLWAFMCALGAVVKTESPGWCECLETTLSDIGRAYALPLTTFATKWQKVEYVTVFHLAMRPDGLHFALHLGITRVVRGCHSDNAITRLSIVVEKKMTKVAVVEQDGWK